MANETLLKNQNLWCNIDFQEIKEELITLFQSPNPIYIYRNSQNIKDKFSLFISCLTLKIKDWFDLKKGEDTFIMSLYKDVNYDKIWFEVIDNYLKESKNFDLLNYIYFVKVLNKDKQYLAKGLLKLYIKVPDEEIVKFLKKFKSKIHLHQIKQIYDRFDIKNLKFDNLNLREDLVEHFIEKIYLQLWEKQRDLFLDNFILKNENSDFNDNLKVVLKIINSYTWDDKFSDILNIVDNKHFKDIKLLIDELINNYTSKKSTFYKEASDLINILNQVDRSVFWKYIKKQIIDKYFSEITNIFYDSSWYNLLDKNNYFLLKGHLKNIESYEEDIKNEYKKIISLKEIILELNDNLFSFFLLPIIYYPLSENLSLRKKDLYKVKYLLLFIFSSNYTEYKKIFLFFNQLEVFLDYGNKKNNFDKLKISFSLFSLVWILLFISYLYFPVWVFIWILILTIIRYTEVIHPSTFYKSKWNVWINFFAILCLCVSSYFWFINFDKAKNDAILFTKQIETLWTISSKEVIDNSYKYIKTAIFWSKIK